MHIYIDTSEYIVVCTPYIDRRMEWVYARLPRPFSKRPHGGSGELGITGLIEG